jgi:hypothetical protein
MITPPKRARGISSVELRSCARTLVDERHDAEHLDLLDVTGLGDGITDLADVERVLVTKGVGLGVLVRGVFPGLGTRTRLAEREVLTLKLRARQVRLREREEITHLGEGTVVPHVAVTVLDKAELAVL